MLSSLPSWTPATCAGVALNGADGFPYIVPLNFGVDVEGDRVYLYFHSANRGEKLDLIARDARASFEMDCNHDFIFYDERMCGKFRDNVHPGESRWIPQAGWNGRERI